MSTAVEVVGWVIFGMLLLLLAVAVWWFWPTRQRVPNSTSRTYQDAEYMVRFDESDPYV
jgi:beta-lactam-binding protein with PASTA domain